MIDSKRKTDNYNSCLNSLVEILEILKRNHQKKLHNKHITSNS